MCHPISENIFLESNIAVSNASNTLIIILFIIKITASMLIALSKENRKTFYFRKLVKNICISIISVVGIILVKIMY